MGLDANVLAAHDDTRLVGAALRHRRQICGLSLRQVAERTGISVGMLSQVERGLAAPSIKTLRAVCAAMDMPVNWLFHPTARPATTPLPISCPPRRAAR